MSTVQEEHADDYASVGDGELPPPEGLWFRGVSGEDVSAILSLVLHPLNFSGRRRKSYFSFSKAVAMARDIPQHVLQSSGFGNKATGRKKKFRQWFMRLLLYCGVGFMPLKLHRRNVADSDAEEAQDELCCSKQIVQQPPLQVYKAFVLASRRRATLLEQARETMRSKGAAAIIESFREITCGMRPCDISLPMTMSSND